MAATLVRKVMLVIGGDDADAELKLERIKVKADELRAMHPDLSPRIDTAEAQAKMAVLRNELKATAAAAAEEGDAMAAAGDKTALAGDKAGEAGGKTELLGKAWGVAKLAILGLSAGLGYGIVKAAGFQQQMEHLHTQAGVAQSQLASLGNGVLQLAGQVGQNPDSLAESLYHVASNMASMGATGPQMLNAVKVAAEGASVGGADLVDVTNALGAAIASGIPGVQNYQAAMGALNATVGAGDMQMQDLAEALGTGFLSNVKIYGTTLNDVGAILATFGDNNIRGAHAGTQLRMSVQSIAVQAATAAPYLKALGLQVGELAKYQSLHGTVATIDLLVQKLKASGVAHAEWGNIITQLFGKKAGAGIAVLIDQYERLNSKTKVLADGAKTFGAAWQAQTKTVQQQFADLKDGSEALAIQLGMKLLPAALQVMKWLNSFVQALQRGSAGATMIAAVIGSVLAGIALKKLEDGLKGAVEGFEKVGKVSMGAFKAGSSALRDLSAGFSNSAAAASDATGIWGTFGGKISTAITAIKSWGIWSKIAAAATKVWTGIQAVFNVIMDANPIVLVVIAIAALVAAVVLAYRHFAGFREVVQAAMRGVEAVVRDVVDFVRGHWKLLLAITTGGIGLIIDALVTHWHAVVDGFRTAYRFVAGIVRDGIGKVKQVLSPFFSWEKSVTLAELHVFEEIWRVTWSVVRAVVSAGVSAVKSALSWFGRLGSLFRGWWDEAARAAGSEIDKLIRFVERIPGRINSALGGLPAMMFRAGVHVIESLLSGITSMIGKVWSVVGGIAHSIAGFFGLSPAKWGPLSGGGAPEIRGQHFAADIAKGMTSGLPRIGTAAARLAGAAALGAAASPAALAGAGGHGPLQVEWVGGRGDQEFLTWIKRNIRIRGGDVGNLGR